MSKLSALFQNTGGTIRWVASWMPGPIRQQFQLAYLLWRLVDTVEDCAAWPRARRIVALRQLVQLLQSPSPTLARHVRSALPKQDAINDIALTTLIAELPEIVAGLGEFPPAVRDVVRECCCATVAGMIQALERATDPWMIDLHTMEDLCTYINAVGAMPLHAMTVMFAAEYSALEPLTPYLLARVSPYAQGVCMADYLEDFHDDLAEHKRMLPPDVSVEHVIWRARQGLVAGQEYVAALQATDVPKGLIGACAGPILFAEQMLCHIERYGPGVTLERSRVATIDARLQTALLHNQPLFTGRSE